jgi:hypothetical protein
MLMIANIKRALLAHSARSSFPDRPHGCREQREVTAWFCWFRRSFDISQRNKNWFSLRGVPDAPGRN